jgi:Glycosyl hydrolase family 26
VSRTVAVLAVSALVAAAGRGSAATKPPPLAFGVTTGIPNGQLTRVLEIQQKTGAHISLVNWFQSFATPLLVTRAQTIVASGRTPVVSWQPTIPGSQQASEIGRILAGDDDAYIVKFARAVSHVPGLVWIRFAPEMNGAWEPWGVGVNGHSADAIVQAWRHVHDLFTGMGVTNARWFWCPNVPGKAGAPLSDLYPGDDVVDIVGLDGYNFGGARPGYGWRAYGAIFADGLQQLQELTTKPIVLGEVATVHSRGREGPWIRDFLRQLDQSPAIHGFVWFDISKQLNTRIDATWQSLAAFRSGFRSLRRGVAHGVSALGFR